MPPVVLAAAFQHTNPGFLKKIFGEFTPAGQVNEVAQKAVLILFNQAVEKVGIATPKSTSDLRVLVRHRAHEIAGSRVHAIHTYERSPKKDAGFGKKNA